MLTLSTIPYHITGVPTDINFYQTGLTAVGGLAQNYDNPSSDQFASGLNNGLAMIQLSIALTVGLCLAAAVSHIVVATIESRSGKKKKVVDYYAF